MVTRTVNCIYYFIPPAETINFIFEKQGNKWLGLMFRTQKGKFGFRKEKLASAIPFAK